MRFELKTITPALASEWLDNRADNRRLRRGTVETYANDMQHGVWRLTHQGIALNERGQVIDGQHRLAAIVLSGITLDMWVAYGLDSSTQLDMDRHAKRMVSDSLRVVYGTSVHTMVVAIANSMRRGSRRASGRGDARAMTAEETRAWLDLYGAEVHMAAALIGGAKARGLGSASVGAALARAFLHAPTDRVSAFYGMVKDPVLAAASEEPASENAVLLNQFLLSQRLTASGDSKRTVYLKTERALRAFLDRVPLKKLYEAASEVFPLPGEEEGER